MTRAEELALKAYPISPSCLSESNGDGDRNYPRRLAFIEGYEQAEKDLALAVEDIKAILDISFWNDDPQKILEEYNRICDTSKVTRR